MWLMLLATTSAKIAPGYGVQFIPEGNVMNNLHRFDMLIGVEVPRWYPALMKPTARWFTEQTCSGTITNPLISRMCQVYKPMFQSYQEIEEDLLKELFQKLVFEIPALLPALDDDEMKALREKGLELSMADQFADHMLTPPLFNESSMDPELLAIEKSLKERKYPERPETKVPMNSFPETWGNGPTGSWDMRRSRGKRSTSKAPGPAHVSWTDESKLTKTNIPYFD
jgi:hypothetical protein